MNLCKSDSYMEGDVDALEALFVRNVLLDAEQHNDHDNLGHPEFHAVQNSRFILDVLKISQKDAEHMGLPDDVFDVSEDVVRQMKSFGIHDYEPGKIELADNLLKKKPSVEKTNKPKSP